MLNRIMLSVFALSVLAKLTSCENEAPGYDQALNPLWEYNYNVGLSGSITPIMHDNMVLFAPKKEITPDFSSNDKLISLDKDDGRLIWEWSDFMTDKNSTIPDKKTKYIHSGVVAFSIGSSNYAVRLSNGETVWKNNTTPSFGDMSGKGELIYRINYYDLASAGAFVREVIEAPIQTGQWTKVFEMNGGDSVEHNLSAPVFYEDPSGQSHMVIGCSSIDLRNPGGAGYGFVTPSLINFNQATGEVEYFVTLDAAGLTNRIDWFPIIDGQRVYLLVASSIVCLNLETGEKIWSRQFGGDFLFSGAIVREDRIYANRDGLDYTLYSIDGKNGDILWQTRSAGTASPLQYHRGVLYFIGGSDGLLHIVNASTGQYIHKITAPSAYSDGDDFFTASGCAVDAENDRLYLSSQTRAYCYPTVSLN